ncbi:MAG: ABC transporter [Rhodobacteraceae bacterium]|nr:MAG: ABC transporter [Paracoccaceae bacterium]
MTKETSSQSKLLVVENMSKSLGSKDARIQIIDGLNLTVRTGEFVSIVGPSGCGKTTLLMCLAGLYKSDDGSMIFNGKEVTGPPEGISVVFQDYSRSLLPWKSNLMNVVFGMRRQSESKAEKKDAARKILSAVGLEGFEDHYPWQLSGGMQQRVAIARALATRSKLVLLDEPLAAVDAQTRAELQDLLLDLAKRFDQTCVLVTHDVDEAVYLADRVIVLSSRPTSVLKEIQVPLAKPRDQISTREDPEYLRIRHDVLTQIRDLNKKNKAKI